MMKKYSEYKDTDIPWVVQIPTHWDLLKIGRTFNKIGSGTTPKSTLSKYYDNGSINWLNTGDLNDGYIKQTTKKITPIAIEENSTLKTYPIDSVVVALYGATIGKLGHLQIETTTNQACCVLSESKKISQRFLFYLFTASREFIISKSYGGGQPNISQDLIKQLYIPAPIIKEQTQIAKYLDYQTGLIDQIIERKELLIKKLKEQRQAIINEAVTKGLNPNAKMKDSGIEWLGEIPEHWEVMKLKYFIENLDSGVSVNSESISIDSNSEEKAILKTSCVFNYNFNISENKQVVPNEIDRLKCPLKKDSIVISRMNTPELVGASGYIDDDYPNIYLPDRLWQTNMKTGSIMDVEYLSFILKSETYRNLLTSKASGTSPSMKNITKGDLLEMIIPVPIEIEQIENKKIIKKLVNKIDNSRNKLGISIEKLKSYRQSIISEAVTGKIDVRDWVEPIKE